METSSLLSPPAPNTDTGSAGSAGTAVRGYLLSPQHHKRERLKDKDSSSSGKMLTEPFAMPNGTSIVRCTQTQKTKVRRAENYSESSSLCPDTFQYLKDKDLTRDLASLVGQPARLTYSLDTRHNG